jgi:pimeloyl-ACP methyl ester carboxylesterase
MSHLGRAWALLLAVVLVAPVAAQDVERWRGVVDLPGAGELEFFVSFIGSGAEATATMSIPAQAVQDVPVSDVVYSGSSMAFTLATTPAAVFEAERDGETAAGTLTQGAQYPISLEKLAAGAPPGPNRPQTPEGPFPYSSRDVTYTNPAEDNTLAGTLTVPPGTGPYPAAILITGSGSQDRDETIFAHKPFWVIADYLSRRGVAVLRVDDRGIGGSDGVRAGLTTADFAGDVAAGVAFLRAQTDIDGDRIGLIGHSEGGLIAPMVAAEDPDIAFLVLLAGTGVDGTQVLRLQNELLLRAAGASEDDIASQLALQAPLWEAMASGADEEVLDARLSALLDHQLLRVPADQREQARVSAFATAKAQTSSLWFRFFLNADPAEYLEQVHVPVLAVNGSLDLQVDADQNLPAIEAALARGGNDDVTIQRFDGLNHLFQHATTGLVAEYGVIEETLAPEVLAFVADWVMQRTAGN